jgi:5-methylcytosine-specific restriction endonuclease McrA
MTKKEYDAARYAAHREGVRERVASYAREHRVELAEKDRRYREAHREEIRTRRAAYHATHREELNQRAAAYHAAHPAEAHAYTAKYRASHPYQRRTAGPDWRQVPSALRDPGDAVSNHNRRALKRGAPGAITRGRVRALLALPCAGCGTAEAITVDHIVPLSKGGHNVDVNLQPLCICCNRRKGATA